MTVIDRAALQHGSSLIVVDERHSERLQLEIRDERTSALDSEAIALRRVGDRRAIFHPADELVARIRRGCHGCGRAGRIRLAAFHRAALRRIGGYGDRVLDILHRERDFFERARIVGLLCAVALLGEHLQRVGARLKAGRHGHVLRAGGLGVRDRAVVEGVAVVIAQDGGNVVVRVRTAALERDGDGPGGVTDGRRGSGGRRSGDSPRVILQRELPCAH